MYNNYSTSQTYTWLKIPRILPDLFLSLHQEVNTDVNLVFIILKYVFIPMPQGQFTPKMVLLGHSPISFFFFFFLTVSLSIIWQKINNC